MGRLYHSSLCKMQGFYFLFFFPLSIFFLFSQNATTSSQKTKIRTDKDEKFPAAAWAAARKQTMPLALCFNPDTTLLLRPIPSSTHLAISSRHPRSWSPISRAAATVSAMAAGSVRVATAQMTSIDDLAANFATCSRLVQVNLVFSQFTFPLLMLLHLGSWSFHCTLVYALWVSHHTEGFKEFVF